MDKQDNTKPKNVDYFHVPDELWAEIKLCLPEVPERQGPGRPRADDRAVWNGIWYHLWTGCQWKAIHVNWFGVCSSTIHERFQMWREAGVFDAILRRMAEYYAERRKIGWEWQSIDSKSVSAPLADDASGRNPTDRGKQGSKIHLLVDERGAPLAIHVTGANEHDKWSADDLIVSIVVDRPDPQEVEQHFCADKGYDSPTFTKRLSRPTMCLTSNTAVAEMNPWLRSVQSQANFAILLVDGWSNAPLAGSTNAELSAPVGPSQPPTGSPCFSSLRLTFSSIWQFTDRF